MDEKVANLARQADKKLKEVDMAITSMSTSISSMEDSLTSATLALPMISYLKGWVTDVVATEWLAAGFPTAPPPNPPMHGRVLAGTQVWGLIQSHIPHRIRLSQTICLIRIGA